MPAHLKLDCVVSQSYTNIFSPNNFKKNGDIILNYFMSNT